MADEVLVEPVSHVVTTEISDVNQEYKQEAASNVEEKDEASIEDVRLKVTVEDPEDTKQCGGKSIEPCASVGQADADLKDNQTEAVLIKEENKTEIKEDRAGVIKSTMEAYKQESLVRKQIKGKPKSGRIWKTEQTSRYISYSKDVLVL